MLLARMNNVMDNSSHAKMFSHRILVRVLVNWHSLALKQDRSLLLHPTPPPLLGLSRQGEEWGYNTCTFNQMDSFVWLEPVRKNRWILFSFPYQKPWA